MGGRSLWSPCPGAASRVTWLACEESMILLKTWSCLKDPIITLTKERHWSPSSQIINLIYLRRGFDLVLNIANANTKI
jgi:hypothetical protein